MLESLVIGAGRGHCQTCPDEAVTVVHPTEEDSDLILVESAESVESHLLRAMVRFETSETGSERVHFLLFPSRNEAQEMEVAHAQMTAQRETASEIAELPQLSGLKVVRHRDHRMEVQGRLDANSRSDLLWSEHRLLLSRITNGAVRCGPMRHLQNPPFHLVKAVKLLLLRLLVPLHR